MKNKKIISLALATVAALSVSASVCRVKPTSIWMWYDTRS